MFDYDGDGLLGGDISKVMTPSPGHTEVLVHFMRQKVMKNVLE